MKKIIKGLVLLIIGIMSILILPNNIDARVVESSRYSVDEDAISIGAGDLIFTSVTFHDLSDNSPQAFGVSARVDNNSDKDISYHVKVYYYDSNNELITESEGTYFAVVGSNSFSLISHDDILYGNSISDIAFYKLDIEVEEGINSYLTTPSKNKDYSYNEYVIDKYDINIVVNENNVLDITETITAYFNVPKHGIFRTIPLRNTVKRLDGSVSKNRAQISNVSVDNEYTTSRENGNYKLKIGSASETLTGEQKYVIKYSYNLGEDKIKDYDELYYNIIGTEWDTVIGNVTFTITMPKEFDESKLGFSSGLEGSTDNSKITYTVNGNKIIGKYNGILGVNEALTVRCELPEGYFVDAGLVENKAMYFIYLIPVGFLIVSFLLWFIFGRDSQVVETVEFYPPEGFNSLEVGFLYKGSADNQDVISLLIYLANKGYIKITEYEERVLFSTQKGFKITKLKEYDGNNVNEKLFLKGLFSKKTNIYSLLNNSSQEVEDDKNVVTSSDLYNNFYRTMNKILANINDKKNKNTIFDKVASAKILPVVLMIIVTYLIITIPPVWSYGGEDTLIVALLFPSIGFSVLFGFLFGKNSIGTKIFGLVWGLGFGGMPWVSFVLPALLENPVYLIGYIGGLVCVIGMILCIKFLPKRTPYGTEIYGKLKGFKHFLETAEKEKLEAMVMENPTYFYDILPFTYVLGVSDKWIKKFETIALQAPTWYDGSSSFNVHTFGTFMASTMSSAQSAMSSSPSSGGGGSSGGGSSGGGSGGGGGGSW